VTVHKGYKVQAALCCDRLPIISRTVPTFDKWRRFREEWAAENNVATRPSDDLVFMRFPFHWLESQEEIDYRKRQQVIGTKAEIGEQAGIEGLLRQEGLDFDFSAFEKQESGTTAKEKQLEEVEVDDPRSALQRRERCLWLIVRYKDHKEWQFPTVDHVPTESMRETLQKLCLHHFGPKVSPYYVGMSPFAMHKCKDTSLGLKGNKTFFYRSHWIPDNEFSLPEDSPVEDWRFVTREELHQLLPRDSWRTVRYGLPLE